MDVSRPANESRPAAVEMTTKGGGFLTKILMGLLAIAALIYIAYAVNQAFGSLGASSAVKSKEYQAVFLTNGQVYFGKLTNVNASYVKLTNIYYLQVQQAVQPTNSKDTAANQQVSLAKLGVELHGPEDVMYVSRAQVLFWENLKTDGKVTKAIQDYIAAGNK